MKTAPGGQASWGKAVLLHQAWGTARAQRSLQGAAPVNDSGPLAGHALCVFAWQAQVLHSWTPFSEASGRGLQAPLLRPPSGEEEGNLKMLPLF